RTHTSGLHAAAACEGGRQEGTRGRRTESRKSVQRPLSLLAPSFLPCSLRDLSVHPLRLSFYPSLLLSVSPSLNTPPHGSRRRHPPASGSCTRPAPCRPRRPRL